MDASTYILDKFVSLPRNLERIARIKFVYLFVLPAFTHIDESV